MQIDIYKWLVLFNERRDQPFFPPFISLQRFSESQAQELFLLKALLSCKRKRQFQRNQSRLQSSLKPKEYFNNRVADVKNFENIVKEDLI